MNIVVCVKRVPLTQEVDLAIDPGTGDVRRDNLAWVINEWDHFAVEEAVRLKEAHGGTVTVVTLGCEDDEEVLRRGLAMGADQAVRIEPGDRPYDAFVTARALAQVIREFAPDLVLTGVQSDDEAHGVVGTLVAEHLGLAHAAVVTGIQLAGDEATVRVELEGGLEEVAKVRLPALFGIQTGINEPRYVSILGIRKASRKPLEVKPLEALGLSEAELTPRTQVEELFLPPETEGAEMIEGDAATVAAAILRIMKEKGVSV